MSNLPPPRLTIASNTSSGISTISSTSTITPLHPFGPHATGFTTLFSTSSFPASNTAPLPSSATTSIPRPGDKGTVFCTSDIPPNTTSAFHRTRTLDYMVVLKGEIVLRVDGGEEVVVGEGEMCVQRGAVHSWINKTDQWCRMLFVMLDAEAVILEDGKVLEDVFIPHKPAQ
ncbi:cupin 2 domain-containing protein [Rhexocercosporidium sp. MPI-PUGE-AT-0058]|nr:cupin 2 domain-containing protein [Rhexocercosporidium sp. MPI-PUGE-AT-0058]